MNIFTHSASLSANGKRLPLFYAIVVLCLLAVLAGCSSGGDGSIHWIPDVQADEEPQPPVNELPQLRPASSASEYAIDSDDSSLLLFDCSGIA